MYSFEETAVTDERQVVGRELDLRFKGRVMREWPNLAKYNLHGHVKCLSLLELEVGTPARQLFLVEQLEGLDQCFDSRGLAGHRRADTHDSMPGLHARMHVEDTLYNLLLAIEVVLL